MVSGEGVKYMPGGQLLAVRKDALRYYQQIIEHLMHIAGHEGPNLGWTLRREGWNVRYLLFKAYFHCHNGRYLL